ncbi:hypothetical protein [Bacillus sp. Man26]|uniref:hypothetical protein n=1 Tax=Niallia sp. BSM11 TaxID=3391576 RepID=UPI001EDA2A7A
MLLEKLKRAFRAASDVKQVEIRTAEVKSQQYIFLPIIVKTGRCVIILLTDGQ